MVDQPYFRVKQDFVSDTHALAAGLKSNRSYFRTEELLPLLSLLHSLSKNETKTRILSVTIMPWNGLLEVSTVVRSRTTPHFIMLCWPKLMQPVQNLCVAVVLHYNANRQYAQNLVVCFAFYIFPCHGYASPTAESSTGRAWSCGWYWKAAFLWG